MERGTSLRMMQDPRENGTKLLRLVILLYLIMIVRDVNVAWTMIAVPIVCVVGGPKNVPPNSVRDIAE